MLLVVNIGNSNIRFAAFKGDEVKETWTVSTKPYSTGDECLIKFKDMYIPFRIEYTDIAAIVIGSVVPQMTAAVFSALRRIHGMNPVIVNIATNSPVLHSSKQMGADLYANAVAAHQNYPGKKKIIVDFGTALTFMALDEDGRINGVVIAPGIYTSLKALINETAQLPEIELEAPDSVLGMDTETCMKSGIIYGFLSMVEGMVDRINKEVGEESYVIATGGLGGIYEPLTPKINVFDRLHTVKGLKILYELNKI